MKRMLTSCFGLGLLPIAPGTWGSLPVAAVFMLLCYSGAGPMVTSIVMIIIMLIHQRRIQKGPSQEAIVFCVVDHGATFILLGCASPAEVIIRHGPCETALLSVVLIRVFSHRCAI